MATTMITAVAARLELLFALLVAEDALELRAYGRGIRLVERTKVVEPKEAVNDVDLDKSARGGSAHEPILAAQLVHEPVQRVDALDLHEQRRFALDAVRADRGVDLLGQLTLVEPLVGALLATELEGAHLGGCGKEVGRNYRVGVAPE